MLLSVRNSYMFESSMYMISSTSKNIIILRVILSVFFNFIIRVEMISVDTILNRRAIFSSNGYKKILLYTKYFLYSS